MTDNENERLLVVEQKVDLLISDVRELRSAVGKYVTIPTSFPPPRGSGVAFAAHTGKKLWFSLSPEQRAKFVDAAAWFFRIMTAAFAAWAAAKGIKP